jgi:hypothetical protein
MRILQILVAVVAAVSFVGVVHPALACGPCEYEDGLLKICMPKGGCLLPKNPLQDIPKVIDALKSGDPKKMSEAVGGVLTNSPGCIGCTYVAGKIAPTLGADQINYIVGEGFLTFLATDDPVLVVIDVTTNLATQLSLKHQGDAVPAPPPPPARGHKTYSVEVDCIVQQKGKTTYAGSKKAPVLTDKSSGKVFTFPEVDLLDGDGLAVTAVRECKELNDPAKGSVALKSSTFSFEYSKVVPGGASLLKYWLVGLNG